MEHRTSLVAHTPKAGGMGSMHDLELGSCLPHGMAKKKKKNNYWSRSQQHAYYCLSSSYLSVCYRFSRFENVFMFMFIRLLSNDIL